MPGGKPGLHSIKCWGWKEESRILKWKMRVLKSFPGRNLRRSLWAAPLTSNPSPKASSSTQLAKQLRFWRPIAVGMTGSGHGNLMSAYPVSCSNKCTQEQPTSLWVITYDITNLWHNEPCQARPLIGDEININKHNWWGNKSSCQLIVTILMKFPPPPQKLCNDFFRGAQDHVLFQLTLIMQKIIKKHSLGPF